MRLELTPDQVAFLRSAERFAAEHVVPVAASLDEGDRFPRELVRRAGDEGLLAVTVPAEWGGAGRDHMSYAVAVEAVARASATVGVILAVSNSLVTEVIARRGSSAQKERWLRRLACGSAVGAFALSEADAGTDATNQQTLATRDGNGYRVSGRKVWVACGSSADVAVIFAAIDAEHRRESITAFLVPLDTPGVERAASEESLGVRGLGCVELVFEDVRVPADALVGAAGEGLEIAREALTCVRVAIAAQALGIGQAAFDQALAHARSRRTFGRPIADREAIQWMLADSATELDAARMLTLKAAAAEDQPAGNRADAAMAKLYASEAAHRAADRAMQILASAGYRRGSVVERLFRDVRGAEIYSGTSEAQRMIIANAILK
jgi:butyryl-CoA dehydrogenase